jgi:uncharacterized membrane protein
MARMRPAPHWDAHQRFLAAVAGAIAVFWLAGRLHLPVRLIVSWNVYALISLALAWLVVAGGDPYDVRRKARLQDSSRAALFALVITAAVASLFAVAWLLESSKDEPPSHRAGHVVLGLVTVAVSWLLVHTAFALRYAHQYYRDANRVRREEVAGGMAFPGGQAPDYLDFAYFSFVIGMTFQVSDVQITSRPIRRAALLHGLIAFVFNSAILAILVNVIAGML